MAEPLTSVARYQVPVDRLDEFTEIVERHWVVLRDLELVTDREPEVLVGTDKAGGGLVIELFDWVDADACDRAHTHPAVSGIWEAMGPFAEARGERPAFEFTNLARVRGA